MRSLRPEAVEMASALKMLSVSRNTSTPSEAMPNVQEDRTMNPRTQRANAQYAEELLVAYNRPGLCPECGGWEDGHTSVAGDGYKITGCVCPTTMDANSAALDASHASPPRAGESRIQLVKETPMTQPTADTQALAQLDPGTLLMEVEDIRKRPLTLMVVNEAKEWDSRAKAYLEQAEKSEVRSKINELFRQHKFWLSKFNAAVDPIVTGRKFCASLFSRWEMERKRKADEERRQREEAARKEQERQRIEEAAHLSAQGHEEEAIAHLESPLPPVALPDAKDARGKIEGVTVLETYKPAENDWLIDGERFYAWMVQHPECHAMMKPELGKWKAYLTNAKGKIRPDGMRVVMETTTRNRG
jgi:hypothetical protein